MNPIEGDKTKETYETLIFNKIGVVGVYDLILRTCDSDEDRNDLFKILISKALQKIDRTEMAPMIMEASGVSPLDIADLCFDTLVERHAAAPDTATLNLSSKLTATTIVAQYPIELLLKGLFYMFEHGHYTLREFFACVTEKISTDYPAVIPCFRHISVYDKNGKVVKLGYIDKCYINGYIRKAIATEDVDYHDIAPYISIPAFRRRSSSVKLKILKTRIKQLPDESKKLEDILNVLFKKWPKRVKTRSTVSRKFIKAIERKTVAE